MNRFHGLASHIVANVEDWKRIYDSVEPQNEVLPAPWVNQLDSFQKIIVLRLLRPDKVCYQNNKDILHGDRRGPGLYKNVPLMPHHLYWLCARSLYRL